MDKRLEEAKDEASRRINLLVDSVCEAYGVDYHGLADMLEIDRGWFTRYRKQGISAWHYSEVVNLVELASNVGKKRLFKWVFDEIDNAIDEGHREERENI